MPLMLQKAAKPKVAAKEKVAAAPVKGVLSEFSTFVDRLSELEAIITPEITKALKERKRLEDELRAVADAQVPANEKVVFTGSKANFSLTEKGEQRSVNVAEAKKLLGDKLFLELARILLSDVDKYLSKAQQASCVVTARSGPRKGTLVQK